MTQHQEQKRVSLSYQAPSSIRNEAFSFEAGLDEDEVREYLGLLADQVQAAERERDDQRAEIDRPRAEVGPSRAEAGRLSGGGRLAGGGVRRRFGEISPQAVALFSQAQQVADQLVEEAVRHARDLMTSARNEQREILQRAHEAAEEAVRRTGATQVEAPMTAYATAVPEVEYVRTFARVAQVQLVRCSTPSRSKSTGSARFPSWIAIVATGSNSRAAHSRTNRGPPVRLSPGEAGGGSSIYEQVWGRQGRAPE